MRSTIEDKRRELSHFIRDKCHTMGLQCVCPYFGLLDKANSIEFAAYLPQFGGVKGIFVDPMGEQESTILAQKNFAAQLETPISFVNAALFTQDVFFLDSLRDWGYVGKQSELSQHLQEKLHIFRSDG